MSVVHVGLGRSTVLVLGRDRSPTSRARAMSVDSRSARSRACPPASFLWRLPRTRLDVRATRSSWHLPRRSPSTRTELGRPARRDLERDLRLQCRSAVDGDPRVRAVAGDVKRRLLDLTVEGAAASTSCYRRSGRIAGGLGRARRRGALLVPARTPHGVVRVRRLPVRLPRGRPDCFDRGTAIDAFRRARRAASTRSCSRTTRSRSPDAIS